MPAYNHVILRIYTNMLAYHASSVEAAVASKMVETKVKNAVYCRKNAQVAKTFFVGNSKLK